MNRSDGIDMDLERSDAADAFNRARTYHNEVRAIQTYYSPFRAPTSERSIDGKSREGAPLVDRLFDGTGVEAAFNFSSQMKADWMPPFEQFFKLEAGLGVEEAEAHKLNRLLEGVTRLVHGRLNRVHLAADEMFQDLFAGTGAMLLTRGPKGDAVRGVAVPILELALDNGPYGDIWRIWWKRRRRLRDLPDLWPDGTFSTRLARAIKDTPNAMGEVMQRVKYSPADDRWHLAVWCDLDDKDGVIWRESFVTNPWIVPRYFKVPGEAFGRGLAHIGLPFVRTANRVRELALKAAALAIMGLWMRRNDGVFNPDTVRFEPLAMWTVKATGGGGALGPSIARLPVPQNFDIASIVMQEEREQINKVLLNDDLPGDQESVRSATEIAGRLRRAARRRGGAGHRIALELVEPLVWRAIDILGQAGEIDGNLAVQRLMIDAKVTAPAAAAQSADKVQRAVDWMQMIAMLLGPQAVPVFAEVEKIVPDMARQMGLDESAIRSDADKREMMELLAQAMAQAQAPAQDPAAAGAAAAGVPAPNGMLQ